MTIFLVATALQAAVPDASGRIDILVPQPCNSQDPFSDEVVICAKREGESPYRLKQPVRRIENGLPKAQVNLADGVAAAVETEAANVGGFQSNRAMVRLKVRF